MAQWLGSFPFVEDPSWVPRGSTILCPLVALRVGGAVMKTKPLATVLAHGKCPWVLALLVLPVCHVGCGDKRCSRLCLMRGGALTSA